MLTWVEINTNAIRGNIESVRSILPPTCRIMVIVKANAYGHGLSVVAPVAAERADWLGVNSIEEALAVRALAIEKPIVILGYTERERLDAVVRGDFRQVVYRTDAAAAISQAAVDNKALAHIHLKIETGTNRQGIPLDELPGFLREIRLLPNLDIEGAYTHFANIEDTLDPSFAQMQLQRFRTAVDILDSAGVRPPQIHAAATAGALLYPETGFTMIRLGIGTYGIWPSRETQLAARERGRQISLTPALAWKTRVAQVKHIAAGEYVGYGLTYQARRAMKTVVAPIGYYDGYDRKLSNAGRALVQGQPAPVTGRVAMNMTMFDVTEAGAQLDDEVVLIGRQGATEIRVEELAEKIGTIAYEVISRINPQIPRIEV
jgi:alanine racemase